MPVNVDLTVERSVTVACSARAAFAFLSEPERTAPLFPGVESLKQISPGVWRWQMQNLTQGGLSHQIIYQILTRNDGQNRIEWEPHGDGNAKISGGWLVKSLTDQSCVLEYKSVGDFEVGIPRLMKNIAESMVKAGFETPVDEFLKKIKHQLETKAA